METDPERVPPQTQRGEQQREEVEEQMEEAARSARQRLWAADVSCYYAQRRFSQTGRAADRRIWEGRQQEMEDALAAVREAERALHDRGAAKTEVGKNWTDQANLRSKNAQQPSSVAAEQSPS